MVIGWSLSSSGLELDVADHGCGVAVELGRVRGVSSSVPARGSDCVSQDPSHDGVDKSGVDKGDVVEVRLVPEFEGWRLLGVHALSNPEMSRNYTYLRSFEGNKRAMGLRENTVKIKVTGAP